MSTPALNLPPTEADVQAARRLRHALHRHPELSGGERETARRITEFFAPLAPDEVVTGLGGSGVAFAFGREGRGPTVLLRCELDALPVADGGTAAHRSRQPGVGHQCGHDGHMAILAATGRVLARQRPARGRVVLLYQPAEETGMGAAAVLADPKFQALHPEYVFAMHNIPGLPLGDVALRSGTFACASRGMTVALQGRPAHAAQPETGISPQRAMCALIDQFDELPSRLGLEAELAFATVVGARLGDAAFGVAPGNARVMATLRSEYDETMATMVAHCVAQVESVCRSERLSSTVSWHDEFAATVNAPAAVAALEAACANRAISMLSRPQRWSEDFGLFTARYTGAMFGLGAGVATPDLHATDYDFPDDLIAIGADIYLRLVRQLTGGSPLRAAD